MNDNPQALRSRRFERLVFLGALAVGLTSLCLMIGEMGKSAELAYRLRDLESDRVAMMRENDRMLAEIDRMRSLQSVRARQVFLGMVKPTHVEYMSLPTNDLALR